MRLSQDLSNSVLSIGNRSDVPDGGISQVLYSYRRNIFPRFKHITNFKIGNKFYKLLIAVFAVFLELCYLLFDRKIKIVHVHTPADIAFVRSTIYIYIAKFFGKKVIVHIHSGRFDTYYLNNRTFVDKVFSKCDMIIVLTKKIRDFYLSEGLKKVVVINNIIEYPHITNAHYDDRKTHLLFLGGITVEKGVFDLMDVIVQNKKSLEGKLHFHIAGNKDVDKLISIIKEFHLENIVTYEGWLDGEKKIEFLNKTDIFILPSHTEGLPISILEALSYGKYIVSTRVGGIPEIVNEKNGVLFEAQNKAQLEEILKSISAAEKGKYNREQIKDSVKEYLPDNVALQLEDLYSQILSRI